MRRLILANAGAMAGTVVATSGLGYLFWLVAARRYEPAAVGLAAAAVSAMLLLGNLAATGLGTMLIAELPRRRGSEGQLIVSAVVAAAGLGGAFALLFAVLAPYVASGLRFAAGPVGLALFVFGVVLTAAALVVDQALVGLLRGDLQFGRNALFAGIKLAALAVAGVIAALGPAMTIYAVWAAGNLLSFGALAALLARRRRRGCYRPQWSLLRALLRPTLAHHALNMALAAPTMVLPLIVTAELSPTLNAYFYTASMIAGLAAVAPPALTTALFAAGARRPEDLGRHTRLTLTVTLFLAALVAAAVGLAGRMVLGLFGAQYAAAAWVSLVLLTLGVFPLTVKHHYVAFGRVRGAIPATATVMAGAAVLELVAAGIGAGAGSLNGLSLGWLVALCLEALCLAPPVLAVAAPTLAARWRAVATVGATPRP